METSLIRDALRSCFGSSLAEDPSMIEGVSRVLESFVPGRESFGDLSRRMEDFLFNALYDRLGPGMTFRMEDGSAQRIRLSDLPRLADEMLYPLFATFKPWSLHYERLHAWWMETGSFSAMRALYLHFSAFLPEQDRLLIERVVRENLPAAQQAAWFRDRPE